MAWNKPVTRRVRVRVSASSETLVLSKVERMAVKKKRPKATNEMTTAVVIENEGPKGGWMTCLPWTPATTTSEMTNRRSAWLKAPTRERRVKPKIFSRREPRPIMRMTEIRESVGANSELDA